MTLRQAEDSIARSFGWLSGFYVPDPLLDEVRACVNRAQQVLYKERAWTFASASGTFATVAGTGSYDGASRMDAERGFRKVIDRTNTRMILPIPFESWLDKSVDVAQGTVDFAAAGPPTAGSNPGIYLHRTPDAIITVDYWFWRLPTALAVSGTSASGQALDIPTRWEPALLELSTILSGEIILPPEDRGLLDRHYRLYQKYLSDMKREEGSLPDTLLQADPLTNQSVDRTDRPWG